MSLQTDRQLSYRSLLAVKGIPRLLGVALLGRVAGQMLSVAIVLFCLERYHSSSIAGVAVFASLFPGLLFSPLAGALLDRQGRTAMIRIDYLLAATCLLGIVVLARVGALPVLLLVAIAAIGSLTGPLSNAGTRTLFPMLVPRALWDRANAADSAGFVVAVVVGPALAGTIAGLAGGSAALVATTVVFLAAAVSLTGVPNPPRATAPAGSLVGDARDAVRHVASHATLRGLALSVAASNLGYGIAVVGLPVLVLGHLHHSAGTVGALWAAVGVAGAVSGLVVGRFDSDSRERALLISGMLMMVAVGLMLAVCNDLGIAVVAMILFGLSNGPVDIGLFALRQRRTDPQWLGRAFAVSMAMNFAGVPVGSLLGGAVLTVSVTLAFLLMALANLAGALLALSIPRHGGGSSAKGWRRRGGTSVGRQDRHPSQSRPDPFLD